MKTLEQAATEYSQGIIPYSEMAQSICKHKKDKLPTRYAGIEICVLCGSYVPAAK